MGIASGGQAPTDVFRAPSLRSRKGGNESVHKGGNAISGPGREKRKGSRMIPGFLSPTTELTWAFLKLRNTTLREKLGDQGENKSSFVDGLNSQGLRERQVPVSR